MFKPAAVAGYKPAPQLDRQIAVYMLLQCFRYAHHNGNFNFVVRPAGLVNE